MLTLAAALCVVIGIIHSSLGERFILIRLFRGDGVPHLFGSDSFTKRTLRFTWHMSTVAWWGFAYLLWSIASGREDLARAVLHCISAVFFLSALLAFGFTRGRHLSWVVFITIAGLAFFVAGHS